MKKHLKKGAIIAAGIIVTVIGLIMMPVPGPGGTPITLAGLAILAIELPAAKKIREHFLALRSRYYEKASKGQRVLIVSSILVFYVVFTVGMYQVWNSVKKKHSRTEHLLEAGPAAAPAAEPV